MGSVAEQLRDALSLPAVDCPPPGVYPNVPFAVYHAWPAASNSRLSRLRQSPAHLKAYLDEPSESSMALKIGRGIHSAILEPDAFLAEYSCAERCGAVKKGDGQQCSNVGLHLHKTLGWLCGVHAKVPGEFDTSKAIISETDYRTCLRVKQAAWAHPATRAILGRAEQRELSVVWVDAATGVSCKARFDVHAPKLAEGVIADVKSTENASKAVFSRSIYTWGYHRQGAFYLDAAAAHGLTVGHYLMIAVEKSAPYAVAVYRLTDGDGQAIDAGRRQNRILLDRYAECLATNEWPGYSAEVEDVTLPEYAWNQIAEEVAA